MFKGIISKVQAFLIGSIVLAVASGVAVVAVAYGLYALLRLGLTPPLSAVITAVVFAVVAGVSAMMLLKVFSSKTSAKAKPTHGRNPPAMQAGMEAGMAVMGLLADTMVSRRETQRAKDRSKARQDR